MRRSGFITNGDKTMIGWNEIIEFQKKFYPDWLNKSVLLYATALAGEAGEICGVITHLEGGGTNLRKYTEEMVLHQCVDTYNQLVLLLARYGFTPKQFSDEFDTVMKELYERLEEKNIG